MTHSDSLSSWMVPGSLWPTWKKTADWQLKIRLRGKFCSALETKRQVKLCARRLEKRQMMYRKRRPRPRLNLLSKLLNLTKSLSNQPYISTERRRLNVKYGAFFFGVIYMIRKLALSQKWSDTHASRFWPDVAPTSKKCQIGLRWSVL